VAWGAVLLILYSLGLGIPFIALALGFQRAKGSLEWLKRHGRSIEIAGGAMLVASACSSSPAPGDSFFIPLQRYFARFGWPPI